MPRKQKFNPTSETANTKFKNNPYFYNRTETNNSQKYDDFLRDLRSEFRNLQRENFQLKKQLTLKEKEAEKLNASNELLKKETEKLKSEIELLKEENVFSKKKCSEQGRLILTLETENESLKEQGRLNLTLKTENERLKELVELYSCSIKIYQDELATKIAGRVKPELDSYFLNFN